MTELDKKQHAIAPDVLEDVLGHRLDVVFCGTAAGKKSASLGLPYAGPGNKFWGTLHAIRLTDRRLSPADFKLLPEFKLGLTDVAKRSSGADSELSAADFDGSRLEEHLLNFAPRVIAFNGKKAASAFSGKPTGELLYGRQETAIAETIVWVLPSTSGAASRYWNLELWHELAAFIRLSK